MRKAVVASGDQIAGYLTETDKEYQFIYDKNYLSGGQPISISFPLRAEPYESKELFNFFKGLLPEGEYLDIVSKVLKVDSNDSFGILIGTCGETIGTVTVHKA